MSGSFAKTVTNIASLGGTSNVQLSGQLFLNNGLTVTGGTVSLPAGTVTQSSIGGITGSIVDSGSAQTISGTKTFTNGLTVNGGLVTLPNNSVQTSALAGTFVDTSSTQATIGGTKTFTNLINVNSTGLTIPSNTVEITATGGTFSTYINGGYYCIQFANTATFTIISTISPTINIQVELFGGGGSGGGSDGSSNGSTLGSGGGGGGSGGMGYGVVTFVNGAQYTATIGNGGTAVSFSSNGNAGGVSTLVGTGVSETANGGGGGGRGNVASGGGVGGTFGTGSGTYLSYGSGMVAAAGGTGNLSSGGGGAGANSSASGSTGGSGLLFYGTTYCVGGSGGTNTVGSYGNFSATAGSGGGGGNWSASNGGSAGQKGVFIISLDVTLYNLICNGTAISPNYSSFLGQIYTANLVSNNMLANSIAASTLNCYGGTALGLSCIDKLTTIAWGTSITINFNTGTNYWFNSGTAAPITTVNFTNMSAISGQSYSFAFILPTTSAANYCTATTCQVAGISTGVTLKSNITSLTTPTAFILQTFTCMYLGTTWYVLTSATSY